MSRPTASAKAEEVEEIKNLAQEYKVVGVASLQKVRAAQLQELRKKLENSAYLRVVKNALVKRAFGECKEKPGLEKLEEHLSGSNIFLFSNLSPFKLALLLERSRVKTTAKAGDIAAFDVTVSAGNTGLPPGPIISQLGSVGLPTRIESGSVWVSHDTLVAKKGEVISARLASVLSKLGIKPVEVELSIKAAYDDGSIIVGEQMRLDLEGFMKSVESAQASAFYFSLNVAYPMPENMSMLLQSAHQEAYRLALNASVPTADTIVDLIRKANAEMLSLSNRMPKVKEKTAPSGVVEKG